MAASNTLAPMRAAPQPSPTLPDGGRRFEYTGHRVGAVPYTSPHTGRTYRVGATRLYRFVDVAAPDVAWFTSLLPPDELRPVTLPPVRVARLTLTDVLTPDALEAA